MVCTVTTGLLLADDTLNQSIMWSCSFIRPSTHSSSHASVCPSTAEIPVEIPVEIPACSSPQARSISGVNNE